MHDLLLRAIRERRLLTFGYRDQLRVVEPHRFGEAHNGHQLLNAWLRPGHSRSTPGGGWRNFLLDDVQQVQLLDETFAGPREGYAAEDARMAKVFAELPAAPTDATRVDHTHEPPNAVHIDPHRPRKNEIGG